MKKQLLFIAMLISIANELASQSLLGIDVSGPNGVINWSLVKSSGGKTFAFAKATRGICYTDGQFYNYIANGKSAGVLMGTYHYALPEDDGAVAEASYFLSTARSYIGVGYLPPALDIEDPKNSLSCPSGNTTLLQTYYSTISTPSALATWIETWCDYVYNNTGVAPIVYIDRSTAGFLPPGVINTSRYKLWIADPDNCPTCIPNGLGIWAPNWLFKQYYNNATVAGVQFGPVDLDVFNGTANDLNNLLGGSKPNLTQQSASMSIGTNSITFNNTVVNNGTATSGSCEVGYWLSTSSTFATWDYKIGASSLPSLGVGGTATLNPTFNLCGLGIPNGTYYVGYFIDDLGAINESNENDNAFYWPSPSFTLNCAPAQPDLIITPGTQSVSQPTIAAGSYVTAYASEDNQGTATSGVNDVTLWLSSDPILNTLNDVKLGQISNYPSLSPSTESPIYNASVQIPWNTPTGSYYLFFWADGNGAVNESVENNNFATKIINVTCSSPTSVTASASSNSICSGHTLTLTGGGTNVTTWSWSGPGSFSSNIQSPSFNVSPSNAGTFTLTASNSCGPTTAYTFSVTVNQAPTSVTASASSNSICSGHTLTLTGGGTNVTTWSWSGPGSFSSNIQSPSFNVSPSNAGTFTVTAGNTCGTTPAYTSSVTIISCNLNISANVTMNVTCNGGSNGSVSSNASGGVSPYTYSWAPTGGTNATANNLTAGNYTVTVTDNLHGTASAIVNITQPASAVSITMASHTDVNCNGNNTGSATANAASGGISPYNYAWTPSGGNGLTASNLTSATYTITATDNHGCIGWATATITQPALILSVTTSVFGESNCNYGGNANAIPSGGTSPYTYIWSNGSSNVSNSNPTGTILPAGVYTVTVQDAGGCSATASVTITQTGATVASWWSSKNISCFGGTNGQAISTVYGGNSPYTYAWSPNVSSTGTANNLSANTPYTLMVSDKYGCTSVISITLTQPASALTETITKINDLNCHTINNGSATSNPIGGTSPYTYAWSPSGGTLQTSVTLPANTDNCKVADNHGCTATASVTITAPVVIFATFVKTLPTCNSNSNGSITASGTGGSGGYSYVWAPYGGNLAMASNLSAQTFTVTVTDNSGCSGIVNTGLGQPNAIAVTVPTYTCVAGAKGTVVANATGGTPAYHYTWSNGTSTVGILKTETFPNGSYTVTVTDNFGCPSASANIVIGGCPSVRTHGVDMNRDNGSTGNLTEITIYPNPTNGQFTIAGISKGMTIEIYDYTGKKIRVISAIDISVQINLSNQSDGIYLIRILDKDGNLLGQKKVTKTQ